MKPFTAILFLGGNILLDRAEKLKEEIASGEVDETKAVGMFWHLVGVCSLVTAIYWTSQQSPNDTLIESSLWQSLLYHLVNQSL